MSKLPPVDELRRMRQRGMKLREIANLFGVSISYVQHKLTDSYDLSSPHQSRDFAQVGHQPVNHREIEGAASGAHIELDGVYRPSRLRIHECADLLREWGVQ